MDNLKKRRVTVEFDCEHLENSPIIGDITDEFIADCIKETCKLFFDGVEVSFEDGSFYKLRNPKVAFQENNNDEN